MNLILGLAAVASGATGQTWLVGVEDPHHPPVAAIAAAGGQIRRCLVSSRVCLVRAQRLDADRLRRQPGVRSVEPDAPMVLAATSGGPTPECPDPWELDAVDVATAWAVERGARAPVVAIQDSGFRSEHRDLEGRVAGGWDYGDGDPIPEVAPSGVPEHGTFIAGIVAANADDGFGRTGLAPEGSLFLQKIADSDGYLLFSYAIEAMDDLATAHPEVGVMNYSLAAISAPNAFYDAVVGLGQAGVLVVAAAANCPVPGCFDADNDQYPVYPASYDLPFVVAVASVRPDGRLDPMSHYGRDSVAVGAPGAEICSLGVSSDEAVLVSSGTSYAAPVVAGIAALVRGAWPRLTADEAAFALEASCVAEPTLAGRVRCGGAVSASGALAVPVARLSTPDPVQAAPSGVLSLPVDSVAAEGEGVVVVLHDDTAALIHASAERFTAGAVLALPSGDEVAPGDGTLLRLPLPADQAATLEVSVEARGEGAQVATVWLAPVSADGGVAGPRSPAQGGLTFDLVTTEAIDDPTTTEPEPTETTPGDPDEPKPEQQAAEAGCGCGGGTPPGGWALVLAWAARRRRRSGGGGGR